MQTRRVLGGRYRLIARLGRGGMSVVWRARDVVLDRDVAVKVLAGDRDQPLRDAVRTEALAAARLAHPHIAQVFDYGEEFPDSAPPVQFVVMELLHGRSLADVDLPLPPRSALRICAEVAAALAAAHAQGVVHRDVKPGNVMVTRDGAKVFDFGLAARVGAPELDSRSERIFGTPAYVAPERLAGATVGTAADVYALGVLLYKTLTGEPPWAATTPAALIAAHGTEEPAPLPELDGVPASVGELYRRCLNRDPDVRPAASEVAAALAAVMTGHEPELHVRSAAPWAGSDEAGTAPIGPTRSRAPVGIRRQRATLAMIAAGAVVILGAVVAFVVVSLRPGLPGTPDDRAAAALPATVVPATGSGLPPTSSPMVTTSAGGFVPVGGPPTGYPPGIPTTGGTTGPPVATTGPPWATTGPPPTTGSPTSGPRTFYSDVGTVTADCYGTMAHLLSWAPTAGFLVGKVVPGPAAEASVTFMAGSWHVVMAVTCPSGEPVLSIRDGLPPLPTP